MYSELQAVCIQGGDGERALNAAKRSVCVFEKGSFQKDIKNLSIWLRQ